MQRRYDRKHKAFAYVLALILLAVFSSLAVSMATFTQLGMQASRNQQAVFRAGTAADGGLRYGIYHIRQMTFPLSTDTENVMSRLHERLSARLDGTANLHGEQVTLTSSQEVVVPEIAGPAGPFSLQFSLQPDDRLRLRVTGSFEGVTRTISIDFDLQFDTGGAFDYGLASKGPVCLENVFGLRGANSPAEADLLSMWDGTAFRIQDLPHVDGQVYAPESGAIIDTSGMDGDGVINGVTKAEDFTFDGGLHSGTGDAVEFPVINTAPFIPYATNSIWPGTDTTGKTLRNIVVEPDTNPVFQDCNLQGVIYIKKPNVVRFTGTTQITGVIVTEDASDQVGPSNVIKFENSNNTQPVEELPHSSEFEGLHELTGTFMLAPGFGVRFENDNDVISGTIAAEHVKFENTFTGTLYGSIISYGPEEIRFENSSEITIDRSKYGEGLPAGFYGQKLLNVNPDTIAFGG